MTDLVSAMTDLSEIARNSVTISGTRPDLKQECTRGDDPADRSSLPLRRRIGRGRPPRAPSAHAGMVSFCKAELVRNAEALGLTMSRQGEGGYVRRAVTA